MTVYTNEWDVICMYVSHRLLPLFNVTLHLDIYECRYFSEEVFASVQNYVHLPEAVHSCFHLDT